MNTEQEKLIISEQQFHAIFHTYYSPKTPRPVQELAKIAKKHGYRLYMKLDE